MNSKKQLLSGVIGIAFILLFSISCQKEDEQKYTGTLTVLQKDAYSDVAGRSSELWPPHTTTVFKWDKGSEVQLNHGTSPEETDAHGNLMLVATKVYQFSGTQSEMEELQKAYKEAICDNGSSKFLNLAAATTVLEESLIEGLIDYITNSSNFVCNGSVNKDSILAFLVAGEMSKAISEIENCNWGKTEWKLAFETVLGDVVSNLGHNLTYYHVCNNDAALQVDLVKTFIETGLVTAPAKNCSGPMMFYTPN